MTDIYHLLERYDISLFEGSGGGREVGTIDSRYIVVPYNSIPHTVHKIRM